MRFVYIFLAYLIAPLWIGALALRGFRDKTHWRGFSQRFGLGSSLQGRSIWVHAVSVGEVQAAVPLVEALLARFPQVPLVLTTVTPTGRARAEAIFKNRVDVRYVPIDWPGSVRRFFQRVQPQLAVILETEIWPNLYHRCGALGIPLVLASARISPRSVDRYRRLVGSFRAHGLLVPVWDLAVGTGAETLEEPAAAGGGVHPASQAVRVLTVSARAALAPAGRRPRARRSWPRPPAGGPRRRRRR